MCYTEFTISAWRRIFTGIGGDMFMSNESVFLPAAVRDRIWDLLKERKVTQAELAAQRAQYLANKTLAKVQRKVGFAAR